MWDALKSRMSAFYDICDNCKYTRRHFINIAGRIKLKDETNIKNKIKAIQGEYEFTFSDCSIASSLFSLFMYICIASSIKNIFFKFPATDDAHWENSAFIGNKK